jgi:plastocyanin
MRRRNQILPLAFAASLLGGCLGSFGTPGGGPEPTTTAPGSTDTGSGNGAQTGGGDGTGTGTGTGTPTPTPTPAPTMPPATQGTLTSAFAKATDSIRLNETKGYIVTLTPGGGLTGGVTLALDNPPAGVSAKFTPDSVNITGSTPVTFQVDITVAATSATAASVPVAVKATSGSISSTAQIGVTIPNELVITIAKGVALGTAAAKNTTAFSGVATLDVKYSPGLKITWVNNDSINHEIHSQGTAVAVGIAHQGGQLLANAGNVYTQTVNTMADISANDTHCHLHPNMIGPKIHFVP